MKLKWRREGGGGGGGAAALEGRSGAELWWWMVEMVGVDCGVQLLLFPLPLFLLLPPHPTPAAPTPHCLPITPSGTPLPRCCHPTATLHASSPASPPSLFSPSLSSVRGRSGSPLYRRLSTPRHVHIGYPFFSSGAGVDGGQPSGCCSLSVPSLPFLLLLLRLLSSHRPSVLRLPSSTGRGASCVLWCSRLRHRSSHWPPLLLPFPAVDVFAIAPAVLFVRLLCHLVVLLSLQARPLLPRHPATRQGRHLAGGVDGACATAEQAGEENVSHPLPHTPLGPRPHPSTSTSSGDSSLIPPRPRCAVLLLLQECESSADESSGVGGLRRRGRLVRG